MSEEEQYKHKIQTENIIILLVIFESEMRINIWTQVTHKRAYMEETLKKIL